MVTAEMALDHWEPLEHERTYYYHRTTGDMGYLVRREGRDCIKYDRPNQEMIRPFRPDEWNPKPGYRPMTRAQLAQIAFEADKKLCMLLGKHDLGRREWLNLRDEERVSWIAHGPKLDTQRSMLFAAIMASLAPYASSE